MRDDPLRHKCRFANLSHQDRFNKYVYPCPMSGCWLWMGAKRSDGYGNFTIDGRTISAHRQAWAWANTDIPAGMIVCHKCDTPLCVNPTHLFLGTVQDNSDDKLAKKRHLFGERYPKAKLTADDVRRIRLAALNTGVNLTALAKQFGIGRTHVSRVIKGRKWAHIG